MLLVANAVCMGSGRARDEGCVIGGDAGGPGMFVGGIFYVVPNATHYVTSSVSTMTYAPRLRCFYQLIN